MENYRDNRVRLATKFKELGDENPYKTNAQFNDAFENEAGIEKMVNNIKIHFNQNWTVKQFISKFACDKDAFKNSQYCSSSSQPNPEQTTEPEQKPDPDPTEEPTYDKSKFPLKVGIRGPEVAQLQNYLNKSIPFEPLVVDGIFGKKTQDKLIQLQNKLIQLQKYTSI